MVNNKGLLKFVIILISLTTILTCVVFPGVFRRTDNARVMLTFVDDDTRSESYFFWRRLAKETGVKITLAVVPDWIDGNYPTGKTAMNIDQLREMYEEGHDLVSHGYDTLTIQDNVSKPTVIFRELHDSREWLINHGFTRYNGYDVFVWPQGLSGKESSSAKNEVKKYYKYAVNAFTEHTHLTPGNFDHYDIPRFTSDGKSSLRLIKTMRETISDDGWLIVLSHSWHANDYDHGNYEAWASRYRYLIAYAKANNVEIVTLSEGLSIWPKQNSGNIRQVK